MACDDDDNDDPLFKKPFFVYYRSKFQKYNTTPDKATFKLVAEGNKLENGKNKFAPLLLLLPYIFFKKHGFSHLYFAYLSL